MIEYDAYVRRLNSEEEGTRIFETVTLSHSLFSKTYHFVLNSVALTANLPSSKGGALVTFETASIVTNSSISSDDLDQSVSLTIADEQNILDDELDRIPTGTDEIPRVGLSIYHSDHLNAPAEFFEYDVDSVPQQKGIFTIKASVPDLNSDTTGQIYDYDTFPMLRSLS